jgi:tetratricopeptide (TPR) repeat protein
LQGNHFLERADSEKSLRKAEDYLRQALTIDPDFVPAWERLANTYINRAITGLIDFSEGYQQAKVFINKALELDSDRASALSVLGWIAMMYDRDLPAAAGHFLRARALAPNDTIVLGNSSVFAETLGRLELAIELLERDLVSNPLSAAGYGNLAIQYSYVGQLDKAEAMYRKAIELRPDDQFILPWLAKLHLLQGKPDMALSVAEQITHEPRRLWILSMAYHDLGQNEASDEALAALTDSYPDKAASYIAENHAWRGEIDSAFEWLDRAIDESQYMWGSLSFDPAFKNLHDDPRWQVFRTRVGRSEEQLKEIEF